MTAPGQPHHEFHGPVNAQFGANSTQINNSYMLTPSRLDKAADKLSASVLESWNQEAYRRGLVSPPPLPCRWQVSKEQLTGRVAAATAEGTEARFTPLPWLEAATEEKIRAGGAIPELYEVYGGLASGRILLVGPEAAGKSAAAVLLLRRALEARSRVEAPRERARHPVPVLLSLNGWDPHEEEPIDWAVRVVSRRYRQRHVRALLAAGRIALFLDGLDEVTKEVRVEAITALAALPARVLLVSRTVEVLEIAGADEARLSDAVALELQPTAPDHAVGYLLHRMPDPPPVWREVTRRLERERKSPLARALSSPLAISLLHEQRSDIPMVEEILRLRHAAAIENRLLDHAVRFAYTPRKGGKSPPCSPEQAERTLRYIAARLSEEETTDLCWWQIPAWGRRRFRAWVTWSLSMSIYLALAAYMLLAGEGALRIPAALALLAGAAVDTVLRLRQLDRPPPLHSAGWRDVFPRGAIALGGAVYVTAVVLLAGSRWFLGSPAPLLWSFLTAVPFGLGAALHRGSGATLIGRTVLAPHLRFPYEIPPEEFRPSPTAASRVIGPIDVWRHHVWLRLPLGLLVGVAIGVFWGAQAGELGGLWVGVAFGVASGAGPAVRCGVVPNSAVATGLTALQLARSEGTPVRLMAFLKDAHEERNLLRVTGPVYQFRHSRLQERLAGRPR
ncbi:hypothetical protein ACWC10_06405 [Streptomyces sp. NPDC001595]|uniref:hypothetical protein n=1 Tax=Streptomyces sp. NPDC001532 TaxID=3154520 RepID=UPI00331E57AC